MRSKCQTHLGTRVMGFAIVILVMLILSTAAYAQSREDQYGSPTNPADHAGRASAALGVLPDTGGPLVLVVGAGLIIAGTGTALIRRRAAGRG